MQRLYTPHNCRAAYQLDWSYSLFWHHPPRDHTWFDALKQLNEKDAIRLLQHQVEPPHTSKFLISTQPHVPPVMIAQRVKGRLQHLIRESAPKAFRRNYSLRSVGSTRRDKLDEYLRTQLDHHPMACRRVEERLREYQIYNPNVDLSSPRKSDHAIYWYNLHVVFVNEDRWMEIRADALKPMHDMVLRVSKVKGHRLSRAAILPDHIHLALGYQLGESPEEVALCYMNNLAYARGMKPLFQYSYYVGGFSEYDLGVIPRP